MNSEPQMSSVVMIKATLRPLCLEEGVRFRKADDYQIDMRDLFPL